LCFSRRGCSSYLHLFSETPGNVAASGAYLVQHQHLPSPVLGNVLRNNRVKI
jgi:hypothetical protein